MKRFKIPDLFLIKVSPDLGLVVLDANDLREVNAFIYVLLRG
jgi:hypothetical protein